MSRAGFFTVENNTKAEPKHTLINVGGDQFQALAVAFMDYFKRSSRLNDETLKKILERFYFHFPKYISDQPYLTPTERMNMLVNSQRKSEVVKCMAIVLRGLVVDQIIADPIKYKKVFEGLPRITVLSSLYEPSLILPAKALKIFTKITGIRLTLSFVEIDRDLRALSNHLQPQSGITIQVQNSKYYPLVKNKSDYVYVGQLATSMVKPVEKMRSGDISSLVDLISEDDKRLLQTYRKWVQNFLTMLQLQEITQDDLINMFTRFLPENQDELESPSQLFTRLLQSENQLIETKGTADGLKVAKALASTIAQWISLNLVDPEKLFELVENRSAPKSIPA